MATPRFNLLEAIQTAQTDLAKASRAIGKNSTYLQQWMQYGKPKRLPETVRVKLAALLQMDERLLMDADELAEIGLARLPVAPPVPVGPPAGAVVAPTPEFGGIPHDVPILGTVRGGDLGRGDFRFNGESQGMAPRPPGLRGITNAFCLYMQGSSMDPWRREGDPVYVQPGRPVRPGDYVVVELKPTEEGEAPEAVVKRLVAKSTDGTLVLEQFSPAKRFNITGNKVLRTLRVVDWPELLRF